MREGIIQRQGRPLTILGCIALLSLAVTQGTASAAPASAHGRASFGPTRVVHLPPRTHAAPLLSTAQRATLAAAQTRVNRPPRWRSAGQARSTGSAPNATANLVPAAPASPPATPPAAGTLEFFRSTNLTQASTGSSTADVDEPSVSNNGNVVLYTGNWYAAVSSDAGNSFTFANPFTDFPPDYRSFCCDQSTIYDPSRDITIWELMYSPERTGDPTPGLNAVRIAVANGKAGVNNGTWRYWDIQASALGFTSTAPYAWLDYPQLALSANDLYVTMNVFQGTPSDADCGSSPGDCTQLGSGVARLSLTDLATLPQGSVLSGDVYSVDCTSSSCIDTLTPTQAGTSTMYFAADFGTITTPDTSHLRVISWPEASFQPTGSVDVPHPAFNYEIADGVCTDPGGHNACGRDDSRVRTGWISNGLVNFAWDVKQGGTPPGGTVVDNNPYIQGVTADPVTGANRGDFSFFSSTVADFYIDIAANAAGNLGLTMAQSGGGLTGIYPSVVTGIHDDVNSPNWSFNTALSGTNGPNTPNWGDYFTARSDSGRGDTWIVTGYAMIGTDTSTGSNPNSSIVPAFRWFGRARDDPFVPTDLRCTAEGVTPGGTLPNTAVAAFTLRSGLASDYSASVDWGDGTPATAGAISSQGTAAQVTADHTYAATGPYTMTVTIADTIGEQTQCRATVQVGYLFGKQSTAQYSLRNSDGQSWTDLDSQGLSLMLKPSTNIDAVVSGNADLWTATAGYNQDIGIAVSGGSYPTTASQPEAWKESGGFAGTFSPNAAFVQTKLSLTAGTTYVFKLQWKTNKATNNNGATILAGAGPIGGEYSPTTLVVALMPPSPAMTVKSQAGTLQYSLAGSDGQSWQDLKSGNTLGPSLSFTPPQDGTALISGNADLWTSTAGYNQDLGIAVSGGNYPTTPSQPEGWKESGGFAGTFSPNAAFVQRAVHVTATTTYTVKLQWKSNRPDAGSIYAGAGPIGSAYSPTTLTIVFIPGNPLPDAQAVSQFSLAGNDGNSWQPLGNPNPPTPPPPPLTVSLTPASNCLVLLSGNVDLWTGNAGYNQDIGIAVSGGSYPTTQSEPEAWKESGGFAGTFSPNAAFVQTVIPLQAGTVYSFTLHWKTNKASSATIYAAAGPAPPYSETEVTLLPYGC